MSQTVRMLLRVRFAECDAQNVVFNGRYAEYVDVAITEYFRDVFGGYERWLAEELDMQIVRLALDFKSSARFDEVLQIDVTNKHVGNTSFSFQVDITEYGTDRLIAQAEAIYVMVSLHKLEKTPIPD